MDMSATPIRWILHAVHKAIRLQVLQPAQSRRRGRRGSDARAGHRYGPSTPLRHIKIEESIPGRVGEGPARKGFVTAAPHALEPAGQGDELLLRRQPGPSSHLPAHRPERRWCGVHAAERLFREAAHRALPLLVKPNLGGGDRTRLEGLCAQAAARGAIAS